MGAIVLVIIQLILFIPLVLIVGLSIYALILLVKALKIYIEKNETK